MLNSLFKITLISALIVCEMPAFAHTHGQPDNKFVSLKNNIVIGYSLGLNRTEFVLIEGVDLPDAPLGLLRELNSTYSFRLKKTFDISLKIGGI